MLLTEAWASFQGNEVQCKTSGPKRVRSSTHTGSEGAHGGGRDWNLERGGGWRRLLDRTWPLMERHRQPTVTRPQDSRERTMSPHFLPMLSSSAGISRKSETKRRQRSPQRLPYGSTSWGMEWAEKIQHGSREEVSNKKYLTKTFYFSFLVQFISKADIITDFSSRLSEK